MCGKSHRARQPLHEPAQGSWGARASSTPRTVPRRVRVEALYGGRRSHKLLEQPRGHVPNACRHGHHRRVAELADRRHMQGGQAHAVRPTRPEPTAPPAHAQPSANNGCSGHNPTQAHWWGGGWGVGGGGGGQRASGPARAEGGPAATAGGGGSGGGGHRAPRTCSCRWPRAVVHSRQNSTSARGHRAGGVPGGIHGRSPCCSRASPAVCTHSSRHASASAGRSCAAPAGGEGIAAGRGCTMCWGRGGGGGMRQR
jgi:hypothetical protein